MATPIMFSLSDLRSVRNLAGFWISKIFMYQGNPFYFIYGFIRTFFSRKLFIEVTGSIDPSLVPAYLYHREEPRGRKSPIDSNFYSWGYKDIHYESIGAFLGPIIANYSEIARVLGTSFNIDCPTFWRISHIDHACSTNDIYSQVFHQDSVYDQYNVQIFILLDDVGEEDGPFEWINAKYHSKAYRYAAKRSTVSLPAEIPIQKLTGRKGDFLILSTGYTLHRDGIPTLGRSRLMCSIGMFPRYTSIGLPFSKFI